jgi:large subunit ribosomal protein L31
LKAKIHPKYELAKFTCSCGNVIEVGATIPSQHIELCNMCHPFYTGKQKLIDSAGRVERFLKRYAKTPKPATATTKEA